MLPIKLEIEGLYSYKEKQVIDFKTLTSSWLFGIFGKVGSGKSSIIDAITLAVYGKVERLGDNGDNKNYNLMNLDSNFLVIEFDCIIKGEKYKFLHTSKRNKKNTDKVDTPKRSVSIWENDEWIPIDKSGEEILNISYRNFKQAIVIPQGKFQEFISQGAKDRTEMLSEIFNLNKYDLSNKVKKLKGITYSKKERIEGVLSGIPKVNKDELEQKEHDLIKNKDLIQNLKSDINTLEERKIRFSNAKEVFLDYEKTYNEYIEYKKISDNLISIKEKIIVFEEIEPLVKEKNKIKRKKEENYSLLNSLKDKKFKNEEDLLKIDEEIIDLNKKEVDIEKKNIFIEDFKNIMKINKLKLEINEINIDKLNNENSINLKNSELDLIKLEIENLSESKKNLKVDFKNLDFINELIQWHIKNDNLLVQINKLNDSKIKNNTDITDLTNKKELLLSELISIELLNEKKRSLEAEKDKLTLDQKLSIFTGEIKEGVKCPLCGSLEHPHILEIQNVDENLFKIKKELEKVIKDIENNKDLKGKIELIDFKIGDNLNKLDENEKSCKILNEEITELKNNFKWSEIYKNIEEINNLKKKKEDIEVQIEELELKLEEKNKSASNIKNKIQEYRVNLSTLTTEFAFKENEMEGIINNLSKLDYEEYYDTSDYEIRKYIEDYELEVKEYNENFTQKSKIQNELKNEINIIEPQIYKLVLDIDEIENEFNQVENSLKNATNKVNIKDEKLKNILSENFNLLENKKKVNDVETRFSFLKIRLEELIEKKSQNPYLEDAELNNNSELLTKKDYLNEINKNIHNLETEIIRDHETLIKFDKNIKERDEIIKRYDNLDNLDKLFKGKKFVEFVANFYLKNLIYNANKRFSKLTKHQLSLDINEDSNFIIKDYLNGGRIRLLKTLSGGQTFQASFCIALALAESINAINNQDENFFFIDEGFGSLDKDSLGLVFNTLNTLRYEKRIVGVISHVEEFKREVDISITVKRDKKNGSIVKTSW